MYTTINELCAEDRARMDAILSELKNRPSCEHCAEHIAKMYSGTVHIVPEEYVSLKREAVIGKIICRMLEDKKFCDLVLQIVQLNDEQLQMLAKYIAQLKAKHRDDTLASDQAAPQEAVSSIKEEPSPALEDIQKKVVELSAAGKKTEVRAIVKAYADKVSEIPADKLAEVWKQLTALEG